MGVTKGLMVVSSDSEGREALRGPKGQGVDTPRSPRWSENCPHPTSKTRPPSPGGRRIGEGVGFA